MTRHGMVQRSAAGTPPPATKPRASMTIMDADRTASGGAPNGQHRAAERQGGSRASIPALPDYGRAIPDISRNPKSP